MNGERGFAVATTLLVLVAIAALSAAAVFASIMNLRVAENTRSALLAQNEAEQGLDLALIALAQLRHQTGALPTLSSVEAYLPATDGFTITELTTTATGGVVRVVGFGPGGARHATGARFQVTTVTGAPEASPLPLYAIGLVTNGGILLPGRGVYDLNLHAGATIVATGGGSQLTAGRVAAAAGDTCAFHDTICTTFAPPPEIPPYDFDSAYADLRASAPACTMTLSADGSVNGAVNEVICLSGPVTVTLRGTLSNAFVFGPAEASIIYEATSTPSPFTGVGVKIAVGHVDLSSNRGVLAGENTVLTRRAMPIDKTLTADAGDLVRNVFASESDIRLDGGGNGRLVGTFRTNGRFCVQGTLNTFVGSVVAAHQDVPEPLCAGDDDAAGVEAGVGVLFAGSVGLAFTPEADAFVNDDLDGIGEGAPIDTTGIEILSRRP